MKNINNFKTCGLVIENNDSMRFDDEEWILEQLDGIMTGGFLGDSLVMRKFEQCLTKLQELSDIYGGTDSFSHAGYYGATQLSVKKQGQPIIIKRNDIHRGGSHDSSYRYQIGICVGLGIPKPIVKAFNNAVESFLDNYTHNTYIGRISTYDIVEQPATSHKKYANSNYIYMINPGKPQ